MDFLPTTRCLKLDDNSVQLVARIGADLGAFKGHFPECQIFPGVAQIAIVQQVVSEYFANLEHLNTMEQLRFQQFITPEQDLFIVVERTDNVITFKMTNAMQEAVASGRLIYQ